MLHRFPQFFRGQHDPLWGPLRLGHFRKARILNIADFMKIIVEQERQKS
jgi:hypothetical protein